jgi:hypothetical protein
MKTFLIIVVTAAITWLMARMACGIRKNTERVWMVSAVKAPGRMALSDIQADMNAGRYALAKAKMDAFATTWQRFESGPYAYSGPGIGDIMVVFSKLDANSSSSVQQ